MNNTEITITIVAGIFGLVLTILNILQFFKNQNKDGKKEASEIAGMQTDLVYIKDGIGEIKSMVQAQSREQTEIKLKVQKVEDRIESVEARLETIEKRRPKSPSRKGA